MWLGQAIRPRQIQGQCKCNEEDGLGCISVHMEHSVAKGDTSRALVLFFLEEFFCYNHAIVVVKLGTYFPYYVSSLAFLKVISEGWNGSMSPT